MSTTAAHVYCGKTICTTPGSTYLTRSATFECNKGPVQIKHVFLVWKTQMSLFLSIFIDAFENILWEIMNI